MRMQIIEFRSKNQLHKNGMRKCVTEKKRFKGVVLSLDSSLESSGKLQKYSNLVPPTEVLISVAWGAG